MEALSKDASPLPINEVVEEIARLGNVIVAEERIFANLEVSWDSVEKVMSATVQRTAQLE